MKSIKRKSILTNHQKVLIKIIDCDLLYRNDTFYIDGIEVSWLYVYKYFGCTSLKYVIKIYNDIERQRSNGRESAMYYMTRKKRVN